MAEFQVFVVIPVHNNVAYTLGCLRCLVQQTWRSLKVVVVDDGSSDGTAQAIQAEFPHVDILFGDGHLWWTGCMALGVDYVRKQAQSTDFLLTLNNDTNFAPDFVERLVATSGRRERAVVAASCVSSLDGRAMESAGTFLWSRARRIDSRTVMARPGADPEQFQFLTSRAILYPLEVFARIGNFNARVLPQYHADMEFSQRAGRHGFRLFLDMGTPITVFETPETSGDHFNPKPYLSLGEAWKVLTSPRSSLYPPPMFRYIDLCCPRPYRLLNKVSFVVASCLRVFGRTRPGAAIATLVHKVSGRP